MPIHLTEMNTLKAVLKMRLVVNQEAILLLYREGHVFAIPDRCPHLGISLYEGQYDPATGHVTCRGHGAKIQVETGQIETKANLAFFKLPTNATKTYPVYVENNQIYLAK